MVLYILNLIVQGCDAMTVFSFDKLEGKPNVTAPSSMTLSTSLSLPAQFTLCSSHLQGRVDGVGPYQLYGQDGLPWLAFQWVPAITYQDKLNILIIVLTHPALGFS